MGGQNLTADGVMVEGTRDSWIWDPETVGSGLASRVLSFCPNIRSYSLKMASKTRLQYWNLDKLTICSLLPLCHLSLPVSLLSVTSLHTLVTDTAVDIMTTDEENQTTFN